MGQVRYVLLAAAALGNVVEHGEEILRIAAVVADGDLARLDQPQAIGCRIYVVLGRGDDRVALQRLEIGVHDDVRALGRKQLVRSLADQAITRVAGQLLVGPVEQQEAPPWASLPVPSTYRTTIGSGTCSMTASRKILVRRSSASVKLCLCDVMGDGQPHCARYR